MLPILHAKSSQGRRLMRKLRFKTMHESQYWRRDENYYILGGPRHARYLVRRR